MKGLRDELKAALNKQEEAHEEVQKAECCQEAHELMLQWNKEVDKQREKAESCHRELRKSKKELIRLITYTLYHYVVCTQSKI